MPRILRIFIRPWPPAKDAGRELAIQVPQRQAV